MKADGADVRTLHFVNYSESLNEAVYRPTAAARRDGLHLTVVGVPDEVSDATVARLLNETAVAVPFDGPARALHFDELGRGRYVNLYPPARSASAGGGFDET
jgi:hypothetical protein